MKVAYPVSPQVLAKTDVSDIHVAMGWGLSNSAYVGALAMRRNQGHRVYLLSDDDTLKPSMTFDGRLDMFSLAYNMESYKWASERHTSDRILLSTRNGSGHDRIRLVNQAIKEGVFNVEKDHWIFGVPNPAELGVYRRLLSSFLWSKFTVAVSSACFIYSIYGVAYSRKFGRLEKLPGIEDHHYHLGMTPQMMDYEMNREQVRRFLKNQEIVHEFAAGLDSPIYREPLHDIMEGV